MAVPSWRRATAIVQPETAERMWVCDFVQTHDLVASEDGVVTHGTLVQNLVKSLEGSP